MIVEGPGVSDSGTRVRRCHIPAGRDVRRSGCTRSSVPGGRQRRTSCSRRRSRCPAGRRGGRSSARARGTSCPEPVAGAIAGRADPDRPEMLAPRAATMAPRRRRVGRCRGRTDAVKPRTFGPTPSRQEFESLDMSRPDSPEMALVKGGHLGFGQALDEREDTGIHHPERDVAALASISTGLRASFARQRCLRPWHEIHTTARHVSAPTWTSTDANLMSVLVPGARHSRRPVSWMLPCWSTQLMPAVGRLYVRSVVSIEPPDPSPFTSARPVWTSGLTAPVPQPASIARPPRTPRPEPLRCSPSPPSPDAHRVPAPPASPARPPGSRAERRSDTR